jgi:hypothetical protein
MREAPDHRDVEMVSQSSLRMKEYCLLLPWLRAWAILFMASRPEGVGRAKAEKERGRITDVGPRQASGTAVR